MKTANNNLIDENPTGTGLVVSNNILSAWDEVPAGWTGKINGVTNPAKINGVAVADITSVMGV